MKYMGHKGKLMPILSGILADESRNSESIGDAFCGSGAVSWHLASTLDRKIVAGDLQNYASMLAASVIERTSPIGSIETIIDDWISRATNEIQPIIDLFPNHIRSCETDCATKTELKAHVSRCRNFSAHVLPLLLKKYKGSWPISNAYGSYYFSPFQALQIDALIRTAPSSGQSRSVSIAGLISAASKCAASPGHTAQPFQPTSGAIDYIAEAWGRDLFKYLRSEMTEISALSAQKCGKAYTGDFEVVLRRLNAGDVLFADPPYSGVHYSRFYHVLETIATGLEFDPEGRGRYPPISKRPSSEFSQKSHALAAAQRLLKCCADRQINVVLTFPTATSGNGLSVNNFVDIGGQYFSNVVCTQVESYFSTLGGNSENREARIVSREAIVSFRV